MTRTAPKRIELPPYTVRLHGDSDYYARNTVEYIRADLVRKVVTG